jgi:hypothetical protein
VNWYIYGVYAEEIDPTFVFNDKASQNHKRNTVTAEAVVVTLGCVFRSCEQGILKMYVL